MLWKWTGKALLQAVGGHAQACEIGNYGSTKLKIPRLEMTGIIPTVRWTLHYFSNSPFDGYCFFPSFFFWLGFGCRLRVGAPTSCCERWLGWSPKSCEAQSWRPAGIFVGDFSRSFWGGLMDKTGSHKDSTTVVVLCGSVGHLHSIVTNSQVERVAAME